MIPWELLEQATTPDGSAMSLHRRGQELVIRVGRDDLMSSRQHGSEEKLAELGCATVRSRPRARVLVGGLGMGFTLRATLGQLGDAAEVWVAELVPTVVDWNRRLLGHLAAHPLDDSRVTVHVGDVAELIRSSPEHFDAILLDVDNGPAALTTSSNATLYVPRGLREARAALRPGGVYAVWSASPHATFTRQLNACGFHTKTVGARARGKAGGAHHTLWVATRA